MFRVGDTYIDEANWGNAERSNSVFLWEADRGLEIQTSKDETVLLKPEDYVVLGHNGAAYDTHATIASLLGGQEDDFISQIDLMEIINNASHFAKARIEKAAYLVDSIRGEALSRYDLEDMIRFCENQAQEEDGNFDVHRLINVLLRRLSPEPYFDEKARQHATAIQEFLVKLGFFDLTDEIAEAEEHHGDNWVMFLEYAQSSKQKAKETADLFRNDPQMRALLNADFL